jgi:hypothetical protein
LVAVAVLWVLITTTQFNILTESLAVLEEADNLRLVLAVKVVA